MSQLLRWGILGTGNIAGQFAAAMRTAKRGKLVAVGSRAIESARQFAHRFEIPLALGSYDALLRESSVDAVYLSLPNSQHHAWTLKALAAGKHVLCEKPFATSESEAAEMFDAATKHSRVLVEAFMYLSHPQTHAVTESIHAGAIGEVRHIRTSFCYRTTRLDGNIRFDPQLAGGALMDVGCYCTNLSLLIAGTRPARVEALSRKHPSGVDELTTGMLEFPSGTIASLACGMTTQADNTAMICGTEGFIEIPVPWKPPRTQATWMIGRSTPPRQDAPKGIAPSAPPREIRTVDADKDLYALEADDFAATVLDGAPPSVSRELTLNNMAVLDQIRAQIGGADK